MNFADALKSDTNDLTYYVGYKPLVKALVDEHGFDTMAKAMAALSMWKHSSNDATAELVMDHCGVLLNLMPKVTKPIYRGITVSKDDPVAQKNVGDTFVVKSRMALTSWTARLAFAKIWADTDDKTEATLVFETSKVKAPVYLAPLKAMSPALREMLGNLPDIREDEWILADASIPVTLAFKKRGKR